MTTNATLPDPAFRFLSQLSSQLDGRSSAPDDVLRAVGLLTATADPGRAARLRPRAGEPPALIQRLAVWALHRVDSDTIVLAHRLLQPPAPVVALPAADQAVPCCA
ncbi:MAG TPA: hypothetical protein VMM13_19000 [Euzebya sp.]|nr:hypothetical protein [Euzebya sp.]